MYYINLIDKNHKKVQIFQSKSQNELDKFTTCFENEEALVKALNMNPKDFEIVVEENIDGNLRDIRFIGSKYRNVAFLNEKKEQDDLVFYASTFDRENLYKFFLNELLYYDDDISEYDEFRRNNLIKIVDMFSNEEKESINGEYVKKYTNAQLYNSIKNYCTDMYHKPVYSTYKRMSIFLVDLGSKFDMKYSKEDKEQIDKKIDNIKSYIEDTLSINKHSFIDNKKVSSVSKRYIEDIEDNEENLDDIIRSDDIDINISNLDIYLDDFSDDEKREYIEKNKSRIYK